MIDFFRRLVIGNYFLSMLYYQLFKTMNNSAKKEIEKRKEVNLFDFQTLARHLPYYPTSLIKDNCFYGTSMSIQKKLLGFDLKKRCLIEHGLILGDFVQKHIIYSFVDTIVTFSAYRKELLMRKTKKKIITIGPYIRYVMPLLTNEELVKLKDNLGRCLVVFPSHSIDSVEADFDVNEMIKEIERIKLLHNIDSVLICMYWKDIQMLKFESYTKKGYKIVTSGHSFDYYFLNRQRSIIELADFTMSNNVGTHVGYCITLNKPHYIFSQEINQKKIGIGFERELNQRNERDYKTYNNAKEHITRTFSSISGEISDEMRFVVEKYWG